MGLTLRDYDGERNRQSTPSRFREGMALGSAAFDRTSDSADSSDTTAGRWPDHGRDPDRRRAAAGFSDTTGVRKAPGPLQLREVA
jgi:hypothetical protein